jgi:cytochrome c
MSARRLFPLLLMAGFCGAAGSACAQDAGQGAKVFAACAPCHATNGDTRFGPGLGGVVGRTSGTVTGFRYSRAMKSAHITWDDKALDAFIASPQSVVPGSTMPFSGLPDAGQRRELVAYLKTLK